MSDDLVNQLTLNFLISKSQLQKLNKKSVDSINKNKLKEINENSDRIKQLFNNLLVCNQPEDLLCEVKNAFDNFIDKSIYYFKAHDKTIDLENERINNDYIHNDIDFDKEERAIEKGNYKENSEEENENDENEDDENEDDENEDDENENDENENDENENDENEENEDEDDNTIIVNKKCNKNINSVGIEDIQKLPLNWFQNARQNYKKNQIIPRKKEPTMHSQQISNVKKI